MAMTLSCVNDLEEVKKITAVDNAPEESAKDVEMIYSDSAKVKVILLSPELNRYYGEKKYVEFPIGIDVTFYDSIMKVQSKLTADYAISYENTKIMEAKKNVVAINIKNEQLNTEHLVWDQNKKMLYSNVFVKITTPDKILFGDGLEADEQFTWYRIKKLRGTIYINTDSTATDSSGI